jgi:stress-induced morphogen
MTLEQLRERLLTLAPDAVVEVKDLTGTQDHWQAMLVSSAFEGLSMVKQHQLVYGLVAPEVQSGEVHALSLKTLTPEQYKTLKEKKL